MLIFGPALRRPRPLMRAGMIGGMTPFSFATRERAAHAQTSAAASSAAAPDIAAGPNLVADLTRLKELLDSGALTPDEFAAAKTKLLA